MVVSILGAQYQGRPNFMALGWQCRANFEPPMVAIGVHKAHASHAAVIESGAFSLNFPPVELMAETDLVGVCSGEKYDKSGVFTVFTGATGAPMIEECPLCLECELVQQVDLPTNTLFIGEIKGAFADEAALSDGKPDLGKMRALLLTMPDNRYWAAGSETGKAWKEGHRVKADMESSGRLKKI
jgi:flavin reductase (DIM6/NTAB) family NADH-FMN oxidoreductase RutF